MEQSVWILFASPDAQRGNVPMGQLIDQLLRGEIRLEQIRRRLRQVLRLILRHLGRGKTGQACSHNVSSAARMCESLCAAFICVFYGRHRIMFMSGCETSQAASVVSDGFPGISTMGPDLQRIGPFPRPDLTRSW